MQRVCRFVSLLCVCCVALCWFGGVMSGCGTPAPVCQTNADCGSGNATCVDGQCRCQQSDDCQSGQQCEGGVCRKPADADAGVGDTGVKPDTSSKDTGAPDNGIDSSGTKDDGTPDTSTQDDSPNPPDTTTSDSAEPSTDASAPDKQAVDAGPSDASTSDASPPEVSGDAIPEETADLGPCKAGEQRSCYTGASGTVGIGACKEGQRTCTPKGTWGPCIGQVTPKRELCNAKDDDCDGSIDEDFTNLGGSCLAGKGECQVQGRYACRADEKDVFCKATPGKPLQELCDGKDNDCDGVIDNGFAKLHQSCFVGVGECQRQGRVVCLGDGSGTECTASPGRSRPDICDGRDNDCDGKTDEDFPTLGTSCQGQNQSCTITSKYICKTDGSGVVCDVPNTIKPEICDGRDNDCDGKADEDFPLLGKVCVVGKGLCARQGTNICTSDGKGITCSVIPGTSASEMCDGKDNDCDGQTDEDWPTLGNACTAGVGACKVNTKIRCKQDGSGVECATNIQPATELCNKIDDDCDGSVDENFTNLGQSCQKTGACGGQTCPCSLGVYRCRADQRGTECYTQGSSAPEICDKIDNDCDGKVDEDLGTYTCGVGACTSTGQNCVSGQKGPCTPKAPGNEICDRVDNDCDGTVDEGCTCRPSQPTYVFASGHNRYPPSMVTHSPDGKSVISAMGRYNLIKFWDVRTGALTREIKSIPNSSEFQLSPDGTMFLARNGNTVNIYQFSSATLLRTVVYNQGVTRSVFSADNKFLLIIASNNNRQDILIYQISNGAFIGSLKHTERVYSIAFSPDTKTLAAIHYRSVSFWNFATVSLLRKVPVAGSNSLNVSAFSKDNKSLLVGDARGRIYVVDVATGTLNHTFTDATSYVYALSIDASGKYLAASSGDKKVRVWDIAQKTLVTTIPTGDFNAEIVEFSRTGTSLLVSKRGEPEFALYEIPEGRLTRRFVHHVNELKSVHMNASGQRFVSLERYDVFVWNMPARHIVSKYRQNTSGRPRVARITPDGKQVVVGYYDPTTTSNITIVNADNGSVVRKLTGHTSETSYIAMDKAGKVFASIGRDRVAKVWDLATGQTTRTIAISAEPTRVELSPDGKLLAILLRTNPYSIEVWDIAQNKKLHTAQSSTNFRNIYSIAFGPQGKKIAFGSDRNLQLWDLTAGTFKIVAPNLYGIYELAFSFDGEFLAVRNGSSLNIYSTQNFKLLETLKPGQGSYAGLSFAQDGKTMLVGSTDRNIFVYECPCSPGQTRSCFGRISGSPGKGICKAGTQTCDTNTSWGVCTGDVGAKVETYNNIDEDCDGYVDDPFADLQVSSITATPTSFKVGDSVSVRVCVTNKGQATSESTPAKLRIYLGLQASDIPGSAQLLTGGSGTPPDLSFGSIKANAISCQTVNLTMPFIFQGQRSLGAFIDFNQQAPETDDTNNINTTQVTVAP